MKAHTDFQRTICLATYRARKRARSPAPHTGAGWFGVAARALLLLAERTLLRAFQTQAGMRFHGIEDWKRRWRQRGLEGLPGGHRPEGP